MRNTALFRYYWWGGWGTGGFVCYLFLSLLCRPFFGNIVPPCCIASYSIARQPRIIVMSYATTPISFFLFFRHFLFFLFDVKIKNEEEDHFD